MTDYIKQLTTNEENKQRDTLNLIASENYPSAEVLESLGAVWSNKYGEGYPGKRYYAGNKETDKLESYAQELALRVYGPAAESEYGVNVQILSGTPANAMVYLSILNHGDKVMCVNIDNGGHISHMHATSRWMKFFEMVNYDVKEVEPNTYEVDFEDFKTKLIENKPKLVIIGFSAYPRQYKFAEMIKLAHEHGAMVLADVAHINGLIAAGLHDTPFREGIEGADFVSMTTHKTFRGPRAGMVYAKNYMPDWANLNDKDKEGFGGKPVKSLIEILNRTIFPGNSGGPHFNKIAAIARACEEILGIEKHPDRKDFKKYSQEVIDNCKALENGLAVGGLEIISPTQNHLLLIKFPEAMDSLKVQNKLEEVGILTNRNGIPFDEKNSWRPSGMRLGSAALTSRGLDSEGFNALGKLIADYVFDRVTQEEAQKQVDAIVKTLNWWY